MGTTNADVKDAASGDAKTNADGTPIDATDGKGSGADTKDAKTDSTDGDDLASIKKALAAERKRGDTAEKKLRDAELAKLPEIDRLNAETKELTEANEKLTKENTKMKIALDLKMEWTLAKRITGDTEEEMRADAAEILKTYKNANEDPKDKKRPTNDAKKTGDGSTSSAGMNDILRALAGKRGK